MPTIVKHYRNSFLDIVNDNIRILMDPWVYTANEGSWAGSKNGDKYIFNSLKKKTIDYIYISHLHTDHFDLKFIKKLKNKQKKIFYIIIKKFKNNHLKNQLISNGFNESHIIDIPEFKPYLLRDNSKIIILPQVSSSNTPNEYIKYDLDTSCVFIDQNISLYNQVDNPYSSSDIKFIMKNLKKEIKNKFDIAFVPYCAASEFPQSFINLNRIVEKEKIIRLRIKKFLTISGIINSKKIIPSGGSYMLDNIFYKLNKFLAIPKFNKIKKIFNKSNLKKIELIDTEKSFFIADRHNVRLEKNNFYKNFKSVITNKKQNIKYEHLKFNFSKNEINKIINKLEIEMPDYKKDLYDQTKTEIQMCVWPKQPILIKNLKKKQSVIFHKIKFKKIKKIKLKIHVYYKLLLGVINGLVSWNEVQNHCLYERRPNIYEPDIIFWMNLYKNSKIKI